MTMWCLRAIYPLVVLDLSGCPYMNGDSAWKQMRDTEIQLHRAPLETVVSKWLKARLGTAAALDAAA